MKFQVELKGYADKVEADFAKVVEEGPTAGTLKFFTNNGPYTAPTVLIAAYAPGEWVGFCPDDGDDE